MDRIEQMMKEFTEASGPPGFEGEIAGMMEMYLSPVAGISRDKLGSFIAQLNNGQAGPKVMLVAHMDEIGFMVSYFSGRFIKFNTLGGWWPQRLLGLPVSILTSRGNVRGVIASKSPFHMDKKDLETPPKMKDLFIDIGLTGKKTPAGLGIKPGDPIVPHAPFEILGSGKAYMAKAWDNRIGCVIVIEVLKRLSRAKLPNAVFGVGTVQEEVGLRGAITSGRSINPDVCIAVDVNIAQDIPGAPDGSTELLGAGPSICVYDATLIPNTKLRDLVVSVAEKNKIPYHFSAIPFGGTDGGKVHLNESGVPTLVVAVPTRYIHSAAGIVNRKDFDNTVKLLVEVIRALNEKRVRSLL